MPVTVVPIALSISVPTQAKVMAAAMVTLKIYSRSSVLASEFKSFTFAD